MEQNLPQTELLSLLQLCIRKNCLIKLTASKSKDPAVGKMVLSVRQIRKHPMLQLEYFGTDNKATQKNIETDDPALGGLLQPFKQLNLMSTAGNCEYKESRNGQTASLLGGEKLRRALALSSAQPARAPEENNKKKSYLLSGKEPFLHALGIADANGRVYDKKQAKFRQINKFLEIVSDIEKFLPSEGVLHIWDLCCGKSYLSFAVYYYFTSLRGRSVEMTGVDLKEDVVLYCNQTAKDCGFENLSFFAMDIRSCKTEEPVDLVLSLHACDIATDIVLDQAILWQARVILSTPCCQHELNRKLSCPPLDFIARHSMLRQKLCEAATDAVRLMKLEAHGYEVRDLELISPEETPKNILLRGIRRKDFNPASPEAFRLLAEYEHAKRFLMQNMDEGSAL